MSTSRSGTLWLAVVLILLAAVAAQAYQWPAWQVPLQMCELPYRVEACPPATAACAPACPPAPVACAPVQTACAPEVITACRPAGLASVTTDCPPIGSRGGEVLTTCAPTATCAPVTTAAACPPAPAPVAACPPVAECPPVPVAECPPGCPTAQPGGCPTVPTATTTCATTCVVPAGACPSTPVATTTCVTTPAPPSPDYDASKEAHFTGTIASFLNVPCATGETGFVLRLDGGETRTVLDGPQSYASNMNLCANIGDTVDVLGAPDASGNILARQITWQGQTFVMRNEQGYPLWAGAASGSFAQYGATWSGQRTETLSGRVLWVRNYYPGGSAMGPGIEFALDTNLAADYDMVPDWKAEMAAFMQITPVIVQLGPQWAVDQMLPGLRPGQYVTVTGVPADYHRQRVFLATEVSRGGTMVAFRSPSGTPMWAGGWLGWCGTPVAAAGFNPCNLETVCGMVQQVVNTEIAPGMGIHEIVVLQTEDNRMLRVDLGPQWFLQQQGIAIQCGQTVTVTGSVVDLGGQPTMLATTIDVSGRQFALRSDAGIPVWSVAMTCPLSVTASSSAFTPPPQAMAPPTTAVASAAVMTAPAAAPMPPAPSGTASY